MDFDSGYRYPQHVELGYPLQQYSYNDQNTISNGNRVSSRLCPIRTPGGGPRLHVHQRREEDTEIGQRRRVAVACARCRKRKIRCSGDPGDGTGCQNCHSAGLDPKLCAFHRVGSGEATSMMDLHNFNQHVANSQAFMLYNAPASPARSRTTNYPPALDTKSIYQQTAWYNSPYSSEDPSPVEAYGFDQHATYLPTQSPVGYSGNYGWNAASKSHHNSYTGHDSTLYTTNSLPYVHHNIRPAASSEALSNSMTSLQLTLPERPHTRASLSATQRPQLPIPQPSPAQTSRNVVDQMQDQRLRSARTAGKGSFGSGSFPKPLHAFSNDMDAQASTSTSHGLATQTTSAPTSTVDVMTTATTQDPPVSAGTQYNFCAPPLFDVTPTPSQSVYSNFRDSRDYKVVTSSPKSKKIQIPRQASQNNMYSTGSSSSSLSSSNSSDGSTLVSGHRYTPLSHSQSRPQSQATLKSLAKKPTMHWTPSAVSNRSY